MSRPYAPFFNLFAYISKLFTKVCSRSLLIALFNAEFVAQADEIKGDHARERDVVQDEHGKAHGVHRDRQPLHGTLKFQLLGEKDR